MKRQALPAAAGLEVRVLAAECFSKIVRGSRTIDEAVSSTQRAAALDVRDRAFLFSLLLTTFRHLGEIDAVLAKHLNTPLPRKSGLAPAILRLGATQLLYLATPPHAAIDLSVRAAKADRDATHFAGLINAVLRKVAAEGSIALGTIDSSRVNVPDWLWDRWSRFYGEATARAFVDVHSEEPPLDLSVKSDPEGWAARVGAERLPTGTLRLHSEHPSVPDIAGFADGEWWVQDAAAAIPALLFGSLQGKSVLDLCAAPGGKTLQLCAGGAEVTAVDISEERLGRLSENLTRCGFSASLIVADVLQLKTGDLFDGVLLDAPCSATGTIRRHPELPYIKTLAQIGELRDLQGRLLKAASAFLRPGGMLVYCTCSLEEEEGEGQIKRFLKKNPGFVLCRPPDALLPAEFISSEGWIRVLPHFRLGHSRGLDGFFAAALTHRT